MFLISISLLIIISAIFNFYITKNIIIISKNNNNLALYRDENRSKVINKSRLGGLGLISTQIFFLFISKFIFGKFFEFDIIFPFTILSTVFAFSVMGLIDDLFNLSPFYRLIFQILISITAWNQGLNLQLFFHQDNFIEYFSILNVPIISILLSVLWIAGLTNAINWLDGLDGLAGSFSSFIFLIFGSLFISFGNLGMALICFIAFGACTGFLKHNLYPSKIFMGDGGSYFLGSLLACSTIALNINIVESGLFLNEFIILFLPLFVFFIPVLDMIHVVYSRLSNNLSPFFPDKSHFHHKLKNNGLSVNDIVIFYISITQWISSVLLYFLQIKFISLTILTISYTLLVICSFFYALKIKKARRKS